MTNPCFPGWSKEGRWEIGSTCICPAPRREISPEAHSQLESLSGGQECYLRPGWCFFFGPLPPQLKYLFHHSQHVKVTFQRLIRSLLGLLLGSGSLLGPT